MQIKGDGKMVWCCRDEQKSGAGREMQRWPCSVHQKSRKAV